MQAARALAPPARPPLLDLLRADPQRAFEAFYSFARELFAVSPPRVLLDVAEDLREDVLHDLVLWCRRDDFAVLRKYEDRGKPFASWFRVVAANRIRDYLRSGKRLTSLEEERLGLDESRNRTVAEDRVLDRISLERIAVRIRSMDRTSRLLLAGAAEGRRPRELTKLLGWSTSRNKQASDKLRWCRRRLLRLLAADGIDLESLGLRAAGSAR